MSTDIARRILKGGIEMLKELNGLLVFMRPAFSRRATHVWFVIAFIGFIARSDDLGVTSIVRALSLPPECYIGLLNFFRSSAWSADGLMMRWWEWLRKRDVGLRVGDRLVLAGDHTKIPKDGRKMPAVSTLHQDSETGTKPSYFRGHHWGAVAIVMQAYDKFFAAPAWAKIHEGLEGLEGGQKNLPKTIRLVEMAQAVARGMESRAYLVLDAYFAVGPVFDAAMKELLEDEPLVHIVTRAKKNIVAYQPAPPPKKKRRGAPKKYGRKIKLMSLFDSNRKAFVFEEADALVYGNHERIRYLSLDLLWKPTKGILRFILLESSRGRMILITSDLKLTPVKAMELYCRRVSIETMFDTGKNLLSALAYHFWSKHLTPDSRRPKKKANAAPQHTSNLEATRNTLRAIEKFVNLQMVVLGTLQLLAKRFPAEIKHKANCWLRTVSSNTPSEFVTRMALANIIKRNLATSAEDPITQIIIQKRETQAREGDYKKTA